MADLDKRRADTDWRIYGDNKAMWSQEWYGATQLAVLMDIRRELKTLNDVFRCPNFLAVPRALNRISRNTAKPRKKAEGR